MKKITVILMCGIFLASCSSDGRFKKYMDKHDNAVLTQALAMGDANTAIAAVESLITRDTANIMYLDTLVLLFQNANNQPGVLQASKKLLSLNPNNLTAMDNMAVASKNLRNFQDALNAYAQLYNLTGQVRYLYEVGDVYFQSGQVNEGMKIFEQVINNPKSKTDNISMLLGPGKVAQVPVLTATYNYLGYFTAQNGSTEQAKTFYQKALEISPDFVIAKNNLDNLMKATAKDKDKKGK